MMCAIRSSFIFFLLRSQCILLVRYGILRHGGPRHSFYVRPKETAQKRSTKAKDGRGALRSDGVRIARPVEEANRFQDGTNSSSSSLPYYRATHCFTAMARVSYRSSYRTTLSMLGQVPNKVPRRCFSLTTVTAGAAAVDPPTRTQLQRVFTKAAIPMIGFGFVDQTIMLQAGNAIDCTLGVTFGLSTITAAALGATVSNASGVLFGNTLDRIFTSAGLPQANLTADQRALPAVARVKLGGAMIGVVLGCCLGLVNLLVIDTNRSATLKLQAFNEEQEFEFTIEASNALRSDCTALTVRGPDVDGLLASLTAALAVRGCSLVELHARRSHTHLQSDKNAVLDPSDRAIDDVFYVIQRETGLPFDDEDLEDLARGLLDATRTPMNVNSVKAAMHELENTNTHLKQRIQKLEEVVYKQQISIVPRKATVVQQENKNGSSSGMEKK